MDGSSSGGPNAVAQEIRLSFSDHAVMRYRLRARPALDQDAARTELESLWRAGEITAAPPSWLADRRRDADLYLTVADLSFPIVRGLDEPGRLRAVTCLCRAAIDPYERAARNSRRRRRPRHRGAYGRLAPSSG